MKYERDCSLHNAHVMLWLELRARYLESKGCHLGAFFLRDFIRQELEYNAN